MALKQFVRRLEDVAEGLRHLSGHKSISAPERTKLVSWMRTAFAHAEAIEGALGVNPPNPEQAPSLEIKERVRDEVIQVSEEIIRSRLSAIVMQVREKLGLTLTQMAGRLELAHTSYWNYENERSYIPLDTLVRIKKQIDPHLRTGPFFDLLIALRETGISNIELYNLLGDQVTKTCVLPLRVFLRLIHISNGAHYLLKSGKQVPDTKHFSKIAVFLERRGLNVVRSNDNSLVIQ